MLESSISLPALLGYHYPLNPVNSSEILCPDCLATLRWRDVVAEERSFQGLQLPRRDKELHKLGACTSQVREGRGNLAEPGTCISPLSLTHQWFGAAGVWEPCARLLREGASTSAVTGKALCPASVKQRTDRWSPTKLPACLA